MPVVRFFWSPTVFVIVVLVLFLSVVFCLSSVVLCSSYFYACPMCFYAPSYFFDVRPLCFYSRYLYFRPLSTFLSIVSFCPSCLYFYGGGFYFSSRRLLLYSSVFMPVVYCMPVLLSLKVRRLFLCPLAVLLVVSLSLLRRVPVCSSILFCPQSVFMPVVFILFRVICFYARRQVFLVAHCFCNCRILYFFRVAFMPVVRFFLVVDYVFIIVVLVLFLSSMVLCPSCFYVPSNFFDCFYSRRLYFHSSSTFLSIGRVCILMPVVSIFILVNCLLFLSSDFMPAVCFSRRLSFSLSLSRPMYFFLPTVCLHPRVPFAFLPVCIILPAVCFYACGLYFVPRHLLFYARRQVFSVADCFCNCPGFILVVCGFLFVVCGSILMICGFMPSCFFMPRRIFMPVRCVFMPRRIFSTSVLSVFILVICMFAHRLPFCRSYLFARRVYIFMAVIPIFVPVVYFYVHLFICPSYILCLSACH